MIIFSRIIGCVLFFVLGSQYLFLTMRKSQIEYERELLKSKGVYTFARITRTQKIQSPLGPWFYFKIKGRHNGSTFEKSENISRAMYHLFSVGSNIEIIIAERKHKKTILHIRNNTIKYSNDLLSLLTFSKYASLVGIALIIFGFFIGPLFAHLFRIQKWKDTRPTPDQFYGN